MTSDGSGLSSAESFAEYDPSTSSWRTSQVFLDGDSEMFSETWPPSGTTRNGKAFPRVPLVPRTSGIASGYSPGTEPEDDKAMWPTPTAVQRPNEGNVRLFRARVMSGEMTEEEATAILGKSPFEAQGKIPAAESSSRFWPTPSSRDWKDWPGMATERPDGKSRIDQLARVVFAEERERRAMWPTPTAYPHGPDLAKEGRRIESGNRVGADDLATAVHRLAKGVPAVDTKKSTLSREQQSDLLVTLEGEESSVTTEPESPSSDPSSETSAKAIGQLNPTWVEWLMGFPTGWTE